MTFSIYNFMVSKAIVSHGFWFADLFCWSTLTMSCHELLMTAMHWYIILDMQVTAIDLCRGFICAVQSLCYVFVANQCHSQCLPMWRHFLAPWTSAWSSSDQCAITLTWRSLLSGPFQLNCSWLELMVDAIESFWLNMAGVSLLSCQGGSFKSLSTALVVMV